MNLRERCQKLVGEWAFNQLRKETRDVLYLDDRVALVCDLEDFALQIRNEALEEAARWVEDHVTAFSWLRIPHETHVGSLAGKEIRSFNAAALAASASEEK